MILALRSIKKGGQKRVEELCHHLQGIGIRASVLEQSNREERVSQKRSWTQKLIGTIKLTGNQIKILRIGVAKWKVENYVVAW